MTQNLLSLKLNTRYLTCYLIGPQNSKKYLWIINQLRHKLFDKNKKYGFMHFYTFIKYRRDFLLNTRDNVYLICG